MLIDSRGSGGSASAKRITADISHTNNSSSRSREGLVDQIRDTKKRKQEHRLLNLPGGIHARTPGTRNISKFPSQS